MTDNQNNRPSQDDEGFKPIKTEQKKSGFPVFLSLLAGAAIIGAGGWYVYTETAVSPPPSPTQITEKAPPVHKVKAFFRESNNPFAVLQDVKNQFRKKDDKASVPPRPPVAGLEHAEPHPLPAHETTPPVPPSAHMAPPAPSPVLEERLHSLETQMHELINNMQNQKQPTVSQATNDVVLMQLRTLQEKIDLLQQEQNAKKDTFNQRLRAITLIERLEGDVVAGNDYGDTITSLIQIAPRLGLDEEPLHALQQAVQDAPLSLAALMESFTAATRKAAPYAKEEASTFSAKLQQALAPVVTIRRVDVDSADATDEAHIARSEAELKAGNVDMALTHIRQLSPHTSGYYETWVAEAEQFQSLTQAVESLKTAARQPE